MPLPWRRVFALAVYLYPRAGELEALEWEDIELERGVIHIHRAIDRSRDGETKATKTDTPRRFSLEAQVAPLLRAMHDEVGGAGPVTWMPRHRDLAEGLRTYLEVAGIKRAELFKTDATRKAITFHDLRATGITWMAIRGDEPLRIMQRAGHDDFDTTQRYIREAEAVREGFGEVFPPLTTLLKPRPDRPEWSTIGPRRRDFDRLKRGVSRRYVAGWTGLEPAASGVTGRRYNQLNYHPRRTTLLFLFSRSPLTTSRSFPNAVTSLARLSVCPKPQLAHLSLPTALSSVGGTGFEPATSGL